MSDPAAQFALRERLASEYAAGVLSPALALLVQTQAAIVPSAATDLFLADASGGAFLEQETPVAMEPGALERVFAGISTSGNRANASASVKGNGAFVDDLAAFPAPLRGIALEALARHGWKYAGSGIKSLALDMAGDAKAEILRIEPGAAAPEHTHEGEEFTLVLVGAFHDARGVYAVGDIAHADASVTHKPTGEAGAVCYSLAVTDAPLAFKGALGLMQKIWKH